MVSGAAAGLAVPRNRPTACCFSTCLEFALLQAQSKVVALLKPTGGVAQPKADLDTGSIIEEPTS